MGIFIKKVGKAVPDRLVANQELSRFVETNSEWIVERTGIKERRVCREETGLDLAVKAGRQALEGTEPLDVDLVIVATATPDKIVPSMGALVKKELGLENAVAFDLNTACSGFIYAAWTAASLMNSTGGEGFGNRIGKALIIGVEQLSRIVDWTDRTTCILFGDGAGAVLMEKRDEDGGILASFMKNYDDTNGALVCDISYSQTPFEKEADIAEKDDFKKYLYMQGSTVFKFAVSAIDEVSKKALEAAGLSADDIDYFVPHQANMRIISSAAKKLGQPIEKFQISLEKTGNVSAASVPMALYDLMNSKNLKKGDKIMMMGFGGGLSAGAMIFEI